VFLNWSPYVLLLSGAAAMFLASNAFAAGSLAASQPGLTIVDPLVASTLGVVLFGERLNHAPAAFIGEIMAVALLVISVVVLSRSPLVHDEHEHEHESESESESTPVPSELATTEGRTRAWRPPSF
jgi:drug/metabolite transporter (DMT)-like permease